MFVSPEHMERERNISLPECYKHFFSACSWKIPRNLTGTDLLNHWPDLYDSAVALLKENETDFSLEPDDFVFMMHQGYVFWYFKADGNADPLVYMYDEVEDRLTEKGHFSEFIKLFQD